MAQLAPTNFQRPTMDSKPGTPPLTDDDNSSHDGNNTNHTNMNTTATTATANNSHMPPEIRINIPSMVLEQGARLATMDQAFLAQCLQPVLDSLKDLDAEALLSLERAPDGARLCDG